MPFLSSTQYVRTLIVLIKVSDKAITRVKLAGADSKAEQQAAVHDSLVQVPGEMAQASDGPDIAPEELERRRRGADMGRLRMLDAPRRRDIALMDMLGEFGSKVGLVRGFAHGRSTF
jgi:E3 ubiquitin-protein ligase SHPRH